MEMSHEEESLAENTEATHSVCLTFNHSYNSSHYNKYDLKEHFYNFSSFKQFKNSFFTQNYKCN